MFKRTRISHAAIAALGSGLVLAAAPVAAQTAPAGQSLERVEITGSAIRRVDAETALPVTVIRVEELNRQGVTTVEQALARVAANQSSFSFTGSVGATTGGKAEADLRGLGAPLGNNANKTLILLNGRRLSNHPFDAAAVDLNAIPLSALDRIEILRDGASALYGTDAIGGVINFILKRDFNGLELSATTLQPAQKQGGGDIYRATGVFGLGNLATDRFNILGSVDFRKQRVLEAKDRNFSQSGIVPGGSIESGTSGTSFPGDLNGFEPSLAAGCNPPGSIPNTAGTACRYDFSRDVDIVPKNSQMTGLVRGAFALAPDHTIAAEVLYARNDATSKVAAAPTSSNIPTTSPFFPSGATPTPGGIPNLNNPAGANVPGGTANWRQIPAGKRQSEDDTINQRALVEAFGTLAGFDYRAAAGQARSRSTAAVSGGYVNDGLIRQGVFNGVINPFGAQTAAGTAAIANAQVIADTQIGTSTVRFADARISKELFPMSGGMAGFAFGLEHRREKSKFEATDITAQLGSLGIDSESDTAGSRHVTAAFTEFTLPVLKQLEVTLAGRYDRYSDVGKTFNPKIGLKYQPTPEFAIRGSANKGFRAPTLYEIYQPASLTFTTDNYDDPLLCPNGTPVGNASAGAVCGQQVLQRISGPVPLGQTAKSLSPEKSTSFTAGIIFEPAPRLTFGVDFFSIRVKNLISPVPEQVVFGNAAANASRFVRCSQLPAGPDPTRQDRTDADVCLNYPNFDPIAFIDTPVQNLGELRTRGLDLNASWQTPATSYGTFGFSMDGTYVLSYKYQLDKGGEYIDAKGKYTGNAPIFKWQHVAGANWSMGPVSALIQQRHRSGYTDQGGDRRVASYTTHDISATYEFMKGVRLTAGIVNVFDREPPLSVQTTTFQRGYDPRYTDPIGRQFLVRGEYKFF